MNMLLHGNLHPLEVVVPGSKRSVELSEKHSLALLGFFVPTGLLSVVADIFTNMVPMPAGLRYFWLAICVITYYHWRSSTSDA